MKFTGEFFVPSDAEDSHTSNPELEVEHKQRYQSILSLAQGKNVLDIASGEGYGTFMLSSVAGQVWGVDINPELVAYASQKYGRENNRFLHGSATSIPLEAGLVDLVVSFETLEHISAEDQVQFFKEVRRVLKPGGTFIVSTPNKKNYTDRYDHHNEFHVHELEREGFEGLLKSSFQHVRVYEQGMEIVSVILNKEEFLLKKPVLPVSVNPENYHFEGKYLIGIGSDQPGSIEQSLASFVPESERSYFQMIDRILELQDQVEKLGAWGDGPPPSWRPPMRRSRPFPEKWKSWGPGARGPAPNLQPPKKSSPPFPRN
ncbi:class I SAM-dependent methyltransferase [Puia sp. P3]|uniref:class I SAM-dependent methyltransferase n=1 Tax=Puia sp. P3 TaxID=3423952 RepID=UPI003D669F0E